MIESGSWPRPVVPAHCEAEARESLQTQGQLGVPVIVHSRSARASFFSTQVVFAHGTWTAIAVGVCMLESGK